MAVSFAEFHHAVYGQQPFPWQQALADRVAEQGWPDTVDVATGLGKTRTIAIAVWNLARQVATGGPRTAPLRVLHVVDRTTIVDQTHHDLRALYAALHEAPAGPAAEVAEALRAAFGTPLVIGKLHGGAVDDGDWVAVDQPTVVTMTAHQAVSRALFRGFGVSTGMAPVHAALLGVDSLILFDEPHLSTPALSTLRSMKFHQSQHTIAVPTGQVVQIGATVTSTPTPTPTPTATPTSAATPTSTAAPTSAEAASVEAASAGAACLVGGGGYHGISEEDRSHPVAGARLSAVKHLVLHSCGDREAATVKKLVERARQALTETDQMVAVVVNTVDAARQVYEALTRGASAPPADQAVLVTGRFRAYERGRLEARLASDQQLRLVVGTQAVEAGMDFSAAVLVTEACDWRAFVQRLGRLNRTGHEPVATVHVVLPATTRSGTKAVYGDEPPAALSALLTSLGDGADLSPAALVMIAAEHADQVEQATRPTPAAPSLTRYLLPTVAHSNPTPAADLEVQRFITGIPDTNRVTDVTVLWRHSLDPDRLGRMPPTRPETVTVPVAAVNALIASRHRDLKPKEKPVIADDGESAEPPDENATPHWHSATVQAMVRSSRTQGWQPAHQDRDITPGATVVLPSTIGGHDATGFNPAATTPVTDLSTFLAHQAGQWWHADPDSLPTLGLDLSGLDLDQLAGLDELDPDEAAERIAELLPASLGTLQHGQITPTGVWLRTPPDPRAEHLVRLDDHAAHVAAETHTAARRAGLDNDTTRLLVQAGWRHDDGKTDPAFQAALGATPTTGTLAKPAPGTGFRPHLTPPGWRHESASLASHRPTHPLVGHIIASHHGWARPLLPAADGPHQALPTADTFAQLNHQHGIWGLAWLETLVRLADHRASRTPTPGHHPPATTPTDTTDTGTDRAAGQPPAAIELAGVPINTVLDWWATAGALAAETDHDPHATISYTPGHLGYIATLHTTATLTDIADHVLATTDDLGPYTPWVAKKNEKSPADWTRATLAALDTTNEHTPGARRLLASILDDTTTPHDTTTPGQTVIPLRTVWMPFNSTFLQAVIDTQHVPEGICDVLTHETLEQYPDKDVHHHGMIPLTGATTVITGIPEKRVRPALQPLILAAVARLPATGGPRPVGVSPTGRLHLPLPTHPVTWTSLIALLQTLPNTTSKPWKHVGIDQLIYRKTSFNNNKAHVWEPDQETP